MAAHSTISESEVFSALEQLLENGLYPTSARLREALDNRGSPVTLQRHMAAWYEHNGPAFAQKAAATSRSPAQNLRTELASMSRAAIEEIEQAQADRVAALDQRESEMVSREQDMNARAETLDQREATGAAWMATIREELERTIQNATHQAEILARTQEDLARTRAEQEKCVEALDASEQAAARLQEQLAGAQSQLDTKAGEMAAAKSHVDDLEQRSQVQVEKIEKLEAALNEAWSDLATMSAAKDAVITELKEAHSTYLHTLHQAVVAGHKSLLDSQGEVKEALAQSAADGVRVERDMRSLLEGSGVELVRIAEATPKQAAALEELLTGMKGVQEELARVGALVSSSHGESPEPPCGRS